MNKSVIIQARYGSTRLPGKVLKPIGAYSVLEHVIRRCQKIFDVDVICCTIPDSFENNIVADLAESLGSIVHRGSEQDVLSRYTEAAKMISADIVMRVTSDCPVIDYKICEKLIEILEKTGSDYVSNNFPPSFPHGLDCEVFTIESLLKANEYASNIFDREHVTPWIRSSDLIKKENFFNKDNNITNLRWTLDYKEDLEFFQELDRHLPLLPDIPDYKKILIAINKHPELLEINCHHTDKSRLNITNI